MLSLALPFDATALEDSLSATRLPALKELRIQMATLGEHFGALIRLPLLAQLETLEFSGQIDSAPLRPLLAELPRLSGLKSIIIKVRARSSIDEALKRSLRQFAKVKLVVERYSSSWE